MSTQTSELVSQLSSNAKAIGRMQQATQLMDAGIVILLDREVSLSAVLHHLLPLDLQANLTQIGECSVFHLSVRKIDDNGQTP
jgi:hypothetical protein